MAIWMGVGHTNIVSYRNHGCGPLELSLCLVSLSRYMGNSRNTCRTFFMAPATKISLEKRFWSKVHKSEHCWTWTGLIHHKGYGRLREGSPSKKRVLAHRVSYEIQYGPIPSGMFIDHICRNRACVNPAHLRVVTHEINNTENVIGICWQKQLAKTHCPQGHPYNEKNTKRRLKQGSWRRECKICNRKRANSRYHESKK